ncbi:MAG: glycosyltransferase family 2 protein [Smithella sp.]|jgi:glycosyltransferase involved in cell wall biosynthesis
MSSFISIIVPVYKTEPYLHRCLDSVVNQTHKNLEIILVDDGSPDNCGKICDEYEVLDPRIKVIHQQNAGLSAARNAALKMASGEYIGFVDSDDWIAADMFEILYGGVAKYEAQIAICGYYYVNVNNYREVKEKDTTLYNRKDALHHLILNETFTNHVWNKLFKKELFEGVYFPPGRTFEDIATTYKLFEKAEKIVFLNSSKYYYLQRDNSIIGAKTIKSEADKCVMMYERYIDLVKRYPQKKEILLSGFYLAFVDFGYAASRQRRDYFLTYKKYLEKIIDFATKNKREVWKCRFVGRACKLNYTLFLRETRLAFIGIRFFVLISRVKGALFSRKQNL